MVRIVYIKDRKSVSQIKYSHNSKKQSIGNMLTGLSPNLIKNESINKDNNQIVDNEDYKVLNKKYFYIITQLQDELLEKEMQIQSLLKQNKDLKEKLKKES